MSFADRGINVGWVRAHFDPETIRSAIEPWLRADSLAAVESRLYSVILRLKLAEQAVEEGPRPAQQNAALQKLLDGIESLTEALDDVETAESACDEAEARARQYEVDIDDLVARTKHDLRVLSFLFDASQVQEVRRGNPKSALAVHRAMIREALEEIFDAHVRPDVLPDREQFVTDVAGALGLSGFANPQRQRRQIRRLCRFTVSRERDKPSSMLRERSDLIGATREQSA